MSITLIRWTNPPFIWDLNCRKLDKTKKLPKADTIESEIIDKAIIELEVATEFVNEIESMFNKNLNLFSSVLSEED